MSALTLGDLKVIFAVINEYNLYARILSKGADASKMQFHAGRFCGAINR